MSYLSLFTFKHEQLLFFIGGKPDEMLTAKVFNWTRHVLMPFRTLGSEPLKRKEAKYTGVHLPPLKVKFYQDDLQPFSRLHLMKIEE